MVTTNFVRMCLVVAGTVAPVIAPLAAHGQGLALGSLPAKARPFDEGVSDPVFAALRKELIAAANAGDLETIMRVMDPKIKVHQESPAAGVQELRREWGIDKSKDVFLKEFRTVLSLGGRMNKSGTEFYAPYVSTLFADLDPGVVGLCGVVVQKDAPLYRTPSLKASVIARLSYDVVRFHFNREGWVAVELRDGRKGFMKEEHVRSPIMTRAIFRKTAGQWRLVEFNRDHH
jgi:hypothetical protein